MAFAAAFAFVAPLALAAAANLSSIRHFLGNPAAAGWAQALGTVAAVVGAYWQGQRAFAYTEGKSREKALQMLGQVAGLTVETIDQVAFANEALEASDAAHFAEAAAALKEKVRIFRKISEIPVGDWPSPFLASAFDIALEHLLEVTDDIHRVPMMMRAGALQKGHRVNFIERSGVFGLYADRLLTQVAFYRAIFERPGGPIVRLFAPKKLAIGIDPRPRVGDALARWALRRASELEDT